MIDNKKFREDQDLVDTDTELEHNTVHNTEELENNNNRNLTTAIYETKQDDEVLDENNDFDVSGEADTEMEYNIEIAELQLDNELPGNVDVHYN